MAKIKFSEINKESHNSPIYEAAFNDSQLNKVSSLYGKLLSKEFGTEKNFICISDETFKSGNRKGRGLRFMNLDGFQFRFNFSEKKNNFSNRDQFIISSMDYWNQKDFKTFDKPTRTVIFSGDLNVIMILKKIVNAMKAEETGKIKLQEGFEYEYVANVKSLNEEIEIHEKAGDPGWAKYLGSPSMRAAFAKKMGWENPERFGLSGNDKDFDKMLGKFNSRVVPHWDFEEKFDERKPENDFSKQWVEFVAEIKPGSPEANSLQEDLERTTQNYEIISKTTGYADPDYIFDDLEKILKVIGTKEATSLIIAGDPGLGKTFRVKEYLEDQVGRQGFKVIPAPKGTIEELYNFLLVNYDKVILFDESEKLLASESTKNFFKTLLDTSKTAGGTLVSLLTNNFRCPNDPEWIANYTEIFANAMNTVDGALHIRDKKVTSWYSELLKYSANDLKKFINDPESLMEILDFNQPRKEDSEIHMWLPMPNNFVFKGSCIFITNEKLSNIDSAIISRSFAMDLSFSSVDKWRIMAEILSKNTKKPRTIQEASRYVAKIAKTLDGVELKIDNNGRIAKDPNVMYREIYGTKLNSFRFLPKIDLLEKYFGEDEAILLVKRYGY